jgi:pimeloyl-ACP methyl ester carboxylesterase
MIIEDLQYKKHEVEVSHGYTCAIHQIYQNPESPPVVMIHGAIENARIFYSLNGKGFGPYLARNGYNVFAIDLRGKGASKPKIKKGFEGTMDEYISNDLNKIFAHIRTLVQPNHSWISVGHSWGGVLAMSHHARHSDLFPINKFVLFGTKRKVNFNSFGKIVLFFFGFSFLGTILCWFYGFAPTKNVLRFGDENEPKHYFKDMVRWLLEKKWTARDGFDYEKAIKEKPAPKILCVIGKGDKFFGEKGDSEFFLLQCVNSLSKVMVMNLSKKNGNKTNYGHNNMLSSPKAVEDHFPKILEWLKE